MRGGITRQVPGMECDPDQVRRCMNGIGAFEYLLERCHLAFCRMVKTPVGVRWPGLPVDMVETAIGTPLR